MALECLIQARGNVSLAAEFSKNCSPSVSYGYLNDLKYAPKYKPFREEYNRRTGELLQAMEVDTEYVISRLVELTRPDMPPSTRRQALRDLGQYLGLWHSKRKEVEEHEARKERLTRAIKDERDPEKQRKLIEAVELLSDVM